MIVTRSELGRIENHKIEVLARITIAAKCLENVVTNPLGALFSKAVAASIACSHVERLLRRVDRNNLVGAALEKSKREAARVAEAIERSHAAAVLATECLCNLLCGQAAFTLVDIKARLVPDTHIDAVKNAVLADFDFLGRLLASQQPRAKLKTLAAARSGVGTIEDAFGARSLDQSINDDFAMRLNARRLELRDEIVAVLVDDQTGQLIGFTENKANSIRAFAKRRAGRYCIGNFLGKPRRINLLVLTVRPAARTQRRGRRIGRPGEEAPVVRAYGHRLAARGLTFDTLDRRVVNPRMTTKERLFLVLLQNQAVHDYSLQKR